VGANGSGKSTLLGVLSGEISPATGTVFVQGHNITTLRDRERARIRALLDQHTDATFAFTVREVVGWGRYCWTGTASSGRDREAVESALVHHGLTDLGDRKITELSAGERAKVHFARVMAQETPIVMLDEADADLDFGARLQMDKTLTSLRASGVTVILVTHDLSRVNHLCDAVLGLSHGGVVYEGTGLTPHAVQKIFGVSFGDACRAIGLGQGEEDAQSGQ